MIILEDIILDCDPGHDDAVALMIAIASKDINLLAVTTSAGNQRHSQTLRNAMSLLTLMKRQDIPVASGNTKPLMRSLISGVSMHGVTGLDGADLPSPDFFSQGIPAIELIAKILTDHPQKFLSVHPELRSRIKQIVILGGGMGLGNWGPTTEFNIQVVPEAAKIVLDSGIPIILAPLNVAFEAQLLPNEIEKIHNIDNSVAQTISGLMDFYGISFGRQRWGFKGLPLYDPCTVAWLIDPSKFTSKRCNVEVETKGELTTGETVIDYYHITNRKPNAEVLFHIDRQWFADLTISSIKSFDF